MSLRPSTFLWRTGACALAILLMAEHARPQWCGGSASSSTPATRPSQPSAPTGAGGNAGPTGSRGGGATGAGAAVTPRQWTAQQLLAWNWDSAYAPQSRKDPQPLDEPEAYEALANGDPRPLLVLRDCEACAGGEDAFLSREFDNEQTILLGRWFHAVKMPMDVLEDTHAFHELFGKKNPPHLFVATADGKTRVDLDGKQSQKKLWSAMTKVLKKSYKKNPDSAVKEMRKLLDALDRHDNLVAAAEERLMNETAAKGKDSPSVRKLEEELEELRAERRAVLEEGAEIDDLELREA